MPPPLDSPLDSDLVVIGLTGIGPIRKTYFCSVISITVLVISVIGVIGCTLFGKYLYKRQKSSDKSYQELITLLSANITINSSSSSSSSGLITSYSHPSSRSFHHSSDVKHSTPLKLFSSSTSEVSTSDSQSSEVINTFHAIEIIFNIIFICSSCIYSRIIINKRFYFQLSSNDESSSTTLNRNYSAILATLQITSYALGTDHLT